MADLMVRKGEIRSLDFNLLNQDEGFNVSSKYNAIPTQSIIDIINEQSGPTKIVAFNKVNVRKPGKQGFQRHVIMLELPDSKMVDNTSMNIVIYNSNDRSSSVKMFAGSIRAACDNQMVWGDEIMPQFKINHSTIDWKSKVDNMLKTFHEAQAKTKDTIQQLINKYMSYSDQIRYAHEVSEMLDMEGRLMDPAELNIAHRQEDIPKTAWHTFNRIQYNVMNGGMQRLMEVEVEGIKTTKLNKTHKITDSNKSINLNRQMSDLIIQGL